MKNRYKWAIKYSIVIDNKKITKTYNTNSKLDGEYFLTTKYRNNELEIIKFTDREAK